MKISFNNSIYYINHLIILVLAFSQIGCGTNKKNNSDLMKNIKSIKKRNI